MFTKKSLVSGVLATAMLLGVGSSLNHVGAVKLDDGVGGKGSETGQVIDLYVHGILGDSSSLSTMIRTTTGAKKKGKSYTHNLKYSGQKATFLCMDTYITKIKYPFNEESKTKRKAYDVIFADNTGTIDKQVKYLKTITEALSSHGAKVNIIGHSMGGLSATSYAVKYDSILTNPRINKLVTIGSPINGAPLANGFSTVFNVVDGVGLPLQASLIRNIVISLNRSSSFAVRDLQVGSEATKSIFSNGKRMNKKIKVYSVYGGVVTTTGYKDYSDGVVPKPSALYLKDKVKPSNFKSYYAEGVEHTDLMHSGKVASKVAEWLK